jgi:predicted Zn-dependent peptidase
VERADLSRLARRLLEPQRSAAAVLGPKAALKAGRAFGEGLFG